MAKPDSAIESTEKAVLGSVILNNDLWAAEAKQLKPDDFKFAAARLTHRAMAALASAGTPIDGLTLRAELSKVPDSPVPEWGPYIDSLTELLPKRKSVAHLIATIKTAAARRFGITAFEALAGECMEGTEGLTVPEIISHAKRFVDRLSEYECTENSIDRLPDPLELPVQQDDWIVYGLLLRGGVTLLTGQPGDGKTFLALSAAQRIAFTQDWLGRACYKTKVLVLDKENPRSVIQQRWRTFFDGPVKDDVKLWAGWSGIGEVPSFDDPRLLELAKQGYLLIFDSLVRFHDGDENSVQEMALTTRKIRALANAGASVLLIHHRGKSDINKYRGSSEILANSDIACSLSKSDDGLLTLDVFKTRATAEFKLTIQPDFENGQFTVVDAPAKAERRNDADALAEIISASPGLSQNAIYQQSRMGRTKACDLLKLYDGAKWRSEAGPKNSLRYFPLGTYTSSTSTSQYSSTSLPESTCTSTAALYKAVQSTGQDAGTEKLADTNAGQLND